MTRYKEIVRLVSVIYDWIDEQCSVQNAVAGICVACGKCCDFESFGHRLFVTTPEILHFADKIRGKNACAVARPSWPCFSRAGSPCYTAGRCSYQSAVGSADGETPRLEGREACGSPKGGVDGPSTLSTALKTGLLGTVRKCTVYEHRFAGCRIFCCKGDADFQSELTEAVIKKFKSLCDEFKIPYRYIDLPTALKNFIAETAKNAEKNISL